MHALHAVGCRLEVPFAQAVCLNEGYTQPDCGVVLEVRAELQAWLPSLFSGSTLADSLRCAGCLSAIARLAPCQPIRQFGKTCLVCQCGSASLPAAAMQLVRTFRVCGETWVHPAPVYTHAAAIYGATLARPMCSRIGCIRTTGRGRGCCPLSC